MKDVKKSVTAHCHKKFSSEADQRISLCYLRSHFLPLGSSPHLIWTSCSPSLSCICAATVQAQIISGRYRTFALTAKWTGESGSCQLQGCNFYPGDTLHLLSGNCPFLGPHLKLNLERGQSMMSSYPLLQQIVQHAWNLGQEAWVDFVTDPSTNPMIISHKQNYGDPSILPIMRLSRSYIWCMHRCLTNERKE